MTVMTHLTVSFFFFNDTATTEIYTLSLHDALPISAVVTNPQCCGAARDGLLTVLRIGNALDDQREPRQAAYPLDVAPRSEEHTSELQSRQYLVCRLLLEKKKNHKIDKNVNNSTNTP